MVVKRIFGVESGEVDASLLQGSKSGFKVTIVLANSTCGTKMVHETL